MNPAALAIIALLAGADDPADDPDPGRIVALIDGTPTGTRTLRAAIALAQRHDLPLLLLAWEPEQAACSSVACDVEQMLQVAHAEAEHAGVLATQQVLCGPLPLTQLRSLLDTGDRLVIANILDLEGPLRGLARAILLDPPCTLYVIPPVPERRQPLWARLLAWMLRRGWTPAGTSKGQERR